jgi:hypothetical protein
VLPAPLPLMLIPLHLACPAALSHLQPSGAPLTRGDRLAVHFLPLRDKPARLQPFLPHRNRHLGLRALPRHPTLLLQLRHAPTMIFGGDRYSAFFHRIPVEWVSRAQRYPPPERLLLCLQQSQLHERRFCADRRSARFRRTAIAPQVCRGVQFFVVRGWR